MKHHPFHRPVSQDFVAPGEKSVSRLQVAGFTFIELLIALGLSMILILLMLVTFRSALQSMKRIEQIGRENRMLRAGYFQATKDADFWCSQADPNFPYMQQHLSARMANDGAGRTFATDRIGQGVTGPSNGDDGYKDVDSPFDKRPFRAVKWPKLNTVDGGSGDTRHITAFRLPNDPRSWYRNHIQCNLPSGAFVVAPLGLCTSCLKRTPRNTTTGEMETGERNAAGQPLCLNKKKNPNSNAYNTQCSGTTFVPMAYMDYDAWEECYVWEVQQFFGSDPYPDLVRDLHQGPSAYNPVSNDLWKRVGRKAGWQPWHVVGDYSIVSNCEGNRVNQDGTLDKIADARSIATWKVFEQLGIFGLYGYTTPGELALLQVSSTNETTAVIEGRDNSQNYRRGEIPWMLGTKNATVTTRCISSPASASVANVAVNRTNFYGNMPTYMNMSREPGCVGAPAPLAIDLGIFNSRNAMCGQRTRQHLTSTQIQSTMMFRHAQPMALAYPVTPMRTYLTGSWNYDAMNWDVMYPLLPLSLKFDEIATSFGDGQTVGCLADGGQCRADDPGFHEKQYLARLLSPLNDASVALASNEQWRVIRDKKTYQTWHLPRHYQDDPVAPALHAGSGLDLGLATSIRRYRFNGVDHAWCQIQVVDSEGKPVQALHFKTLSTNFRGARVYWGKKGEITDNFGNSMRIGDSFE